MGDRRHLSVGVSWRMLNFKFIEVSKELSPVEKMHLQLSIALRSWPDPSLWNRQFYKGHQLDLPPTAPRPNVSFPGNAILSDPLLVPSHRQISHRRRQRAPPDGRGPRATPQSSRSRQVSERVLRHEHASNQWQRKDVRDRTTHGTVPSGAEVRTSAAGKSSSAFWRLVSLTRRGTGTITQ